MFESVEQLEKEVKEFQQNILTSSEFVKKLDEIVAAISAQERDFATKSAELTAKIDGNADALRASQAEAFKKLLDENQTLIKHLSDTAAELEAQMKSQVETVKADHQELVQQLTERNRAISSEFGDKGASLIAEIKAIPVELGKSNAALSDSFQRSVSSIIEVANSMTVELGKSNAALSDSFQRSVSSIIEAANSMSASQKTQADALSTNCDNLLASMNEANQEHLAKTAEKISATQKEYIRKIEDTEAEIKSCKADLSKKYDEFLKKLESTNVDQMFKLCQEIKQSMNTKLIIIMSGVGVSLVLALISLFVK